MATIKAQGIYDQKPLQVMCIQDNDEIKFLFDMHRDDVRERIVRRKLAKRYPFAGTFSPEVNSMLNVLNVLQYYFFDEPPDIETRRKIAQDIIDREEVKIDESVVDYICKRTPQNVSRLKCAMNII